MKIWNDNLNGKLYVRNSILYHNTADEEPQIATWWRGLFDVSYSDVQGGWEGEGNIDADPLFVDLTSGDYHLQLNSPCIDAGNDSTKYHDPEDPNNPGYALYPAMGTIRNDMGAYGGPGAANWDVVNSVETKPEELANLPKSFELFQNYPNPFNPETAIQYQLPKQVEVRLEIYNIVGELIKTLVDEKQQAGYYAVQWDGKDERGRPVASGVYLYSLRAGDFVQVRKMILVR